MSELWERSDGESAQAYEAARVYFELGPDRSLGAVGQRLGKSGSLLSRWSSRWAWVDRAVEYDRNLDRQAQLAREAEARKQAEEWQRRDLALRERKFRVAERILDKVEKMLEFPLATVTTETTEGPNGETVRRTTVKPARWSMDSAGRLAERASQLAGEALRNEGSITEINPDLRDENWNIEDFAPPEGPPGV